MLFHPDAGTEDMLRAILHAALVRNVLANTSPWREGAAASVPPLRTMLADTLEWARRDYPAFKKALDERGWRTDELCFADHGHRVTWTP